MSNIIKLDFDDMMTDRMCNIDKICTTRIHKEGEIGDIFYVNGLKFQIIDVQNMHLRSVLRYLYRLEGFSSESEFGEYWNKFTEGHELELYNFVWVHFFVYVGDVHT